MARSKRQQVVPLTQTTRKGRDAKDALFEEVRKLTDSFEYVYLFRVNSMRNAVLQAVRHELKPGRVILGKNRVVARALGTSNDSEYKNGISSLAARLQGNVGVIFTSLAPMELDATLAQFQEPDFARSGAVATRTVVVREGPLVRFASPQVFLELDEAMDSDDQASMDMPSAVVLGETEAFPHSMEPQLRKLGMPTLLKKGVVTLFKDYTVCTVGDTLTPEQGQLLKHLNIMQSRFEIVPLAYYHDAGNDKFEFEKLKA